MFQQKTKAQSASRSNSIDIYGWLIAAFAIFMCLCAAQTASAATYTVTNTSDSGFGTGGEGSLRRAIANANATPDADTILINIASDDGNCTASGVCTINLAYLGNGINPVLYILFEGGALTINGPGANRLIINGTGSDQIFYTNGAIFTLRGVTLTGGNGNPNNGFNGGAIAIFGGTAIISGVHFIGNSTTSYGGGIAFTIGENHRVENCTFSGNSAAAGGAIFSQDTNFLVVNTTISGNTTIGGGGIFVYGSNKLPVKLISTTITENTATNDFGGNGGGGLYVAGTSLEMSNSIIAGNFSNEHPDIANFSGTITSNGFNIIGDSSGDAADTVEPIIYQPTDILDTPPMLDVLGNYGGNVPTRRLQTSSPAIDKGNSALAGTPLLDARRVVRPYDIFTTANAAGGNGADIGAFELIPVKQMSWGYNFYGQLGDGTTTDRSLPTAISGGFDDIVHVEGGFSHALGLRSNGTLLAWGFNFYGQLGDGTMTDKLSPVAVSGLTNVVATAGGIYHSLALLGDGTVMAWGSNNYGQLGDGTTTNRLTPVPVSGITNVVAVAAGYNSSYVLLADGSVKAWGRNNSGQIGDGTTTQRTTPVSVSGLTGVKDIKAGGNSTYALLADGSVRVWGLNFNGQLGDGTTTNRLTPVTPLNLTSNVVQIAGSTQHAAALKADGTLLTWGDDNYGELGDGTAGGQSATPTAIGLANVVEIKVNGGLTTYARLRDGSIFAWGNNLHGEIGNGTTNTTDDCRCQATPTAVSIDAGIGYFGNSGQTASAGSPLANVAAGANQFVRLGGATVNFGNMTTAGTMQIRTFDPSATGLNVSTGFTILANSNGYDITSNAQFADTATVCLKVSNVIDAITFSKLFILHDDDFDGTFDAGTNSRNYQKREICRRTNSFSPFVLAIGPLAPTAANASISGKVLVGKGTGLPNAIVTLTLSDGSRRTARTTSFGYYHFDDIAAGQTVIVAVEAKRYQFAPRVVGLTDNLTDLNFTAIE